MTTQFDSTSEPATFAPGDRTQVVDTMFRVATSMDGYTAQMRRSFALNAHERLAVAALWSGGPMTMTELGQWIPLSRAAVTTLVDRLELAKLVTRGTDPADRRRTVVQVSPEALERWIPVIEPWARSLEQVAAGFDEAEWATIARFLEQLRAATEDHAGRLKELSDAEIQAMPRTPT